MSGSAGQPVSQLDILRQIMDLQRHVKAAKAHAEEQAGDAIKAAIMAQAAAVTAHIRRKEEEAEGVLRDQIVQQVAEIGAQIEAMRVEALDTIDEARRMVMLHELTQLRDQLRKNYLLLRLNPNVILP